MSQLARHFPDQPERWGSSHDRTAIVPGLGISFAKMIEQQATANYGKTTVARTVEREMVESPDRPLSRTDEAQLAEVMEDPAVRAIFDAQETDARMENDRAEHRSSDTSFGFRSVDEDIPECEADDEDTSEDPR